MNKATTHIVRRCATLVLLLCFASTSASPQTAQPSPTKDNLYAIALFASLAEMQKDYGHMRDAIDYRHAFVEKNPELIDGLSTEQGDYRVEYLDREGQIGKYKELQKEFPIFEIQPAKIAGAKLTITVSVSYVSVKKGRLMLAVSDWSDVEFRYDCEQQKYVVSSVKLGGI
jgi:hypothetical protein